VAQTLPLQAAYGAQLTGEGVTQLPDPSHVEPAVADPAVHEAAPPHAVPAAALVVMQALFVQVMLLWQTEVGAGQSLCARQATQKPLPSQSLPPVSLHVVPAGAGAVPQQPATHVGMAQAVLDTAQSAGLVQAMPASHEAGMPPVPLLELATALPPVELDAPPAPPPELEATVLLAVELDVPPVPLLELEATVLLLLAVEAAPPAPPWPEVAALPPQSVVVAASAPAMRTKAAIGLDVSFMLSAPHSSVTVLSRLLTTHMCVPSNASPAGL